MQTQQVIRSGNRFVGIFLIAFVFVHFTIILPYFGKPPAINENVGRAERYLAELQSTYTSKLDKSKHAQSGSRLAGGDSAEAIMLKEKLIQLHERFVELEKSRRTRKFTVPGIGISVSESVILWAYPGFVFVGLAWVLVYRRRLFQSMQLRSRRRKSYSDEAYPVPAWAAPIPYSAVNGSYWEWIGNNFVGITSHGLILFVVIDFLLQPALEYIWEVISIIALLAVVATGAYFITIIEVVSVPPRRRKKRNR